LAVFSDTKKALAARGKGFFVDFAIQFGPKNLALINILHLLYL
jgi:hypothetical protein